MDQKFNSRSQPVGQGGNFSNAFEGLFDVIQVIEHAKNRQLRARNWDDNKKLVYCRFEEDKSNGKKTTILDKKVWLDPSNNWRTVETAYSSPSSQGSSLMTYGQIVEGQSFPTRIVLKNFPNNDEQPPYQISGTLSVRKSNKSTNDFLLPMFGLKEPTLLSPPNRIPTSIWMLAAAIVFFVIALALRAFAKPSMSKYKSKE